MIAAADVVDAVRGSHVLAGSIALLAAPGAMLTVKGGRWHRRWGATYLVAMGLVSATAIVLAVIRPTLFLGLVAVFSFYLAFIGWRAVVRRRLPAGQLATPLDWTATAIALAGALALIGYAAVPWGGVRPGLWPVALTFGGLGTWVALGELRAMRRPATEPRAWWFRHMGNMLGAYIATVSAFSVVSLDALPPLARWLWPTVIGVPLVNLWIRTWRRRFATAAVTVTPAGVVASPTVAMGATASPATAPVAIPATAPRAGALSQATERPPVAP